jgi:MoaA/NifB/PqqE/SkfB family radical SAM enzyme
LDELGIDNLIVRIVRGTPRDPCAKDVDINKFEAFSQRIEEDILSSTLPGYSNFPMSTFVIARDIIGRRLTMKLLRENRYQIPCYAGNLTGVLRSNGDVYPCELLGEKYGNLRDVMSTITLRNSGYLKGPKRYVDIFQKENVFVLTNVLSPIISFLIRVCCPA